MTAFIIGAVVVGFIAFLCYLPSELRKGRAKYLEKYNAQVAQEEYEAQQQYFYEQQQAIYNQQQQERYWRNDGN